MSDDVSEEDCSYHLKHVKVIQTSSTLSEKTKQKTKKAFILCVSWWCTCGFHETSQFNILN